MQTAPNANGFASIGVNFGMTILCIFPTWIVLSELDHTHEVRDEQELRVEGGDGPVKTGDDSN